MFFPHRLYFISFLLALVVHLLILCSWNSLVEKPQNGLAKGLSSLEVTLEEDPQEKKTTSSSHAKNIVDEKKEPSTSKKSVSFSTLPSQQQIHSHHQYRNVVSSSSGALEATPSYLQNPQPLYPEEERTKGHEGTVFLRVAISAEGNITHLVIEHSSGYPVLDHQAAETVSSSWRFRPAHRNGQALSSSALIPIRFSLKE
ncbi:MAG: energy transducer TonB [Chthoniobacterales bacterium]